MNVKPNLSGSKSNFDVFLGDGGLQVTHHNLENIEPGGFFDVPCEIKELIDAMEKAGIACDVSQSSLCG